MKKPDSGWFHYLFETIAITVGILGAFYLDNWNQARIDNKIRQDYVTRLRDDLNADRNDLSNLMNRNERRSVSIEELVPLFDLPGVHPDTFTSKLFRIFYYEDFIENDKTFNDMVNNGRLELLSRDDLKQGLLELQALYERLNAYEEHIKTDNRKYIYDPFMKYDLFKLLEPTDPGDAVEVLHKLSSDVTIKNGCGLFLSNSGGLGDLYQSSLEKIDELDSLIALELR